jgi:hypothetical protein
MIVFKKAVTWLTTLWILFLSSCGNSPIDILNNKINVAIRSENNIDEKEWNDLTQYIADNKDHYYELMEAESVGTKKLTDYILAFCKDHSRKSQTAPEIYNPKLTSKNSNKSQVKVFIENSGSMDGYVKGIKDFEIVIGKLLVLCKDFCAQNAKSDFDVFFINKEVYPAPEIKELTDFARALEPTKSSPYNKGDRSESILNDVIKSIIDSTSENSISILISDCIYSLEPTKDTKGSLGYQQNATMEVFLNKFRNNSSLRLTTCIYKMISDYEGNYFPFDYDPKKKNSISLYSIQAKRPYYIWVIGESARVSDFNKKINFNSLKGFQNSYILSNFTKEKQPYYTVLKETNKVGSFKQTDRGGKDVKSIADIEYDGGIFQFSVAVDLGNIPVDSSYLVTAKNYVAPGFVVKSVEKIDRNKLSQRDFVSVEKTTATHFITVSTISKDKIQDLKLELSNKIPAWVEQSNSTNDTDVKKQLDKTFGLAYLIRGVSDAYAIRNPEQTSYFKITVTIKK